MKKDEIFLLEVNEYDTIGVNVKLRVRGEVGKNLKITLGIWPF